MGTETVQEHPRLYVRVKSQRMPIDAISMGDARRQILDGNFTRWEYVVTPNLQLLDQLADRADLEDFYDNAMLSLPDGWPVAAIASWISRSRITHVPGSDLLEELLNGSGNDRPMVFVGGKGGVHIEELKSRAVARGWVPHHEPAPREELTHKDHRAALVARVASLGSGGLVVIGTGSPRDESFAAELCEARGRGTALCLGMSINFSSGATRRAPWLVRRIRLEWLFRMVQEPRRLAPRYLSNACALIGLIRANIKREPHRLHSGKVTESRG